MTVKVGLLRVLVALTTLAIAACASTPKVSSPFSNAVNLKPQPKLAAKYNVQLGIAYMQRGDLEFALRKLRLALKQNPQDPMVHAALALLYERLGEVNRADKAFHRALHLAPHNPNISNNYAVYLCRTHRVTQGVKRLLATARNPLYRTPEAAYTNAAVCLMSVHHDAEAKRYLKLALQLSPSFEQAAYQLAHLEMQEGDLKGARSRVDHYLDTYTETPRLLALGLQIARKQHDAIGEEHYKQRLRVDFPHSPETRALASSNPNPG